MRIYYPGNFLIQNSNSKKKSVLFFQTTSTKSVLSITRELSTYIRHYFPNQIHMYISCMRMRSSKCHFNKGYP